MATLRQSTAIRLWQELEYIFERDQSTIEKIENDINAIVAGFVRKDPSRPVDQHDAWLITYGDSLKQHGQKGLHLLKRFQERYLKDLISDIHILPFYPWSSDDGFSVIDYYSVDPKLGSWEDLAELGRQCSLMYDAVLNHMSSESDWFKAFLDREQKYQKYFIEVENGWDLKKVFRPRTSPLESEFLSKTGPVKLWTTFSRDQVDLNAKDPGVFVEFVKILLFYVAMGARAIRLDAIGFLWKESGSSCMHHPKTHAVIRCWRALLDDLAPGTLLITETNVPHAQNISYFGNGSDEAHMVYQFPLPPLVLHSFHTGSSVEIRKWLSTIQSLPAGRTYFNFLASHDGIGVLPASGWLDEKQVATMLDKVKQHGGHISYRKNSDGSESPYEMNITYFEALSDPSEPEERRIAKFLAAHCLLLSITGVPAIYIHSLIASLNDETGYRQSGIKRRINRERLDYTILCSELDNGRHRRSVVFSGIARLLRTRRLFTAFDPSGAMIVHESDPRLIALTRISTDSVQKLLVLINLSGDSISLTGALESLDAQGRALWPSDVSYKDAISGKDGIAEISPYLGLWLSINSSRTSI